MFIEIGAVGSGTYPKEYSWKKGDARPADPNEGSLGYEVDESKPEGEQVSINKYLQGNWRLL
jgi:hypothetical protein